MCIHPPRRPFALENDKTSIPRKEFNLSNLFDVYFYYFSLEIFKLTNADVDDDDERETDQLLRDPDDQGFFDEHVSSYFFSFFVGGEMVAFHRPSSPIPCDNNIPLYL
jgi:hypothetical protein